MKKLFILFSIALSPFLVNAQDTGKISPSNVVITTDADAASDYDTATHERPTLVRQLKVTKAAGATEVAQPQEDESAVTLNLTFTVPKAGETTKGWFARNLWSWAMALLMFLYEFTVRLFPTRKDISILSYVIRLIQQFAPNRRLGGGVHD